MSSIHYKFRAELDYKTLQFDGLHIRGEQLVREICAKENLKLELFELQLQVIYLLFINLFIIFCF